MHGDVAGQPESDKVFMLGFSIDQVPAVEPQPRLEVVQVVERGIDETLAQTTTAEDQHFVFSIGEAIF